MNFSAEKCTVEHTEENQPNTNFIETIKALANTTKVLAQQLITAKQHS